MTRTSPIQIRKTVYHDRPGFLICGGGHGIFGLRVFTPSRRKAELLKQAYRATNISRDERWALTSLILCTDRIA